MLFDDRILCSTEFIRIKPKVWCQPNTTKRLARNSFRRDSMNWSINRYICEQDGEKQNSTSCFPFQVEPVAHAIAQGYCCYCGSNALVLVTPERLWRFIRLVLPKTEKSLPFLFFLFFGVNLLILQSSLTRPRFYFWRGLYWEPKILARRAG